MKSELRIEYTNGDVLNQLIQRAYFENGQMGKLIGKENFIEVTPEEDVLHTIVSGMNNVTIKLTNDDLIDGSARFMIDESDGIKLYPISIYCVNQDDNRYNFY